MKNWNMEDTIVIVAVIIIAFLSYFAGYKDGQAGIPNAHLVKRSQGGLGIEQNIKQAKARQQ